MADRLGEGLETVISCVIWDTSLLTACSSASVACREEILVSEPSRGPAGP